MHCVVSIHQVIRIRNIVFATDTHHPHRRQWWRMPLKPVVHLQLERWMWWICNPLCELRRAPSHTRIHHWVLHITSSYVFICASRNVCVSLSLSRNECSHHELRKFEIIQNEYAFSYSHSQFVESFKHLRAFFSLSRPFSHFRHCVTFLLFLLLPRRFASRFSIQIAMPCNLRRAHPIYSKRIAHSFLRCTGGDEWFGAAARSE